MTFDVVLGAARTRRSPPTTIALPGPMVGEGTAVACAVGVGGTGVSDEARLMIDIVDELRVLAVKLDEFGIEYALCGGMAMGVHGHLRTTIDIDMLVLPESLPQVLEVAGSLGYNIRGLDMDFRAVDIRRVSKIDPDSHDLLSLDFLLVRPTIQAA